MSDDPFTQTLNRLWELLESHAPLADMVRLGNRIKLAGANGDPYKPQVMAADLPEVLIEPAGGQVDLFATSTSTRAVQDYAVTAVTGDLRVHTLLFPLKWELVKALSRSGDNLGLPFVRKVRIAEQADRADRGKSARAAGWSLRLIVSVEMWFASAELQG